MSRGANNNGAPVVDGEIHVQRVEKIEVVTNAVLPTTVTTGGDIVPALVKAKGAAAATGGNKVRDVDELAADFIRRNKEAFQGKGSGNQGQTPKQP